jgi:glycosyltransferase 2 family protein
MSESPHTATGSGDDLRETAGETRERQAAGRQPADHHFDDAIEIAETAPLEDAPGDSAGADGGLSRLLVPSGWRMVLSMVGGLAVGIVVILIANPHIATEVHAAQRASVQPVFLLLALLCAAVVIVTDAWSLLVLARVFEPNIARRPVIATALESHLIGGATSFGGFEIPYQIFMLRRGGLSGPQAASVVIFKGLVHTLLLAIVALVSLLPWVDSPITPLQRWLLLGATALLLCIWLVVWLWMQRPLGRSLVPQRLQGKVDELIAAARAFGGAPRGTIPALVGLQLVYWAAMFSILVCVLHALGWRGSVAPIITGQAVMQVLMPLSPLPGGAGVAELSFLALIGPSTPESIHVSSLVLWRFFTWVIPVAAGAVSLGMRGARGRSGEARNGVRGAQRAVQAGAPEARRAGVPQAAHGSPEAESGS